MSSFANERTIEYSIVMRMSSLFLDQFRNVVPFYYWKTREGTNVSKQSFDGKSTKLIAIYSRRPKLKKAYSKDIHIKFNQSILDDKNILEYYGVKTFAATCLSNSFDSIGLNGKLEWFDLSLSSSEEFYIEYRRDEHGKMVSLNDEKSIITENYILERLVNVPSRSWEDQLLIIEKWRKHRASERRGFMNGFVGGYKPIFIVFEEN